jgi:hypothetical protein
MVSPHLATFYLQRPSDPKRVIAALICVLSCCLHACVQVGNAVSPPMASALGRCLSLAAARLAPVTVPVIYVSVPLLEPLAVRCNPLHCALHATCCHLTRIMHQAYLFVALHTEWRGSPQTHPMLSDVGPAPTHCVLQHTLGCMPGLTCPHSPKPTVY